VGGRAGSGGAGGGGGGAAGAGGRGGAGAGGSGTLPNTTIWIAGDSTVQYYAPGNAEGSNGSDLEGWGQELAPLFNDKVTVTNEAIGGRSVAFFMYNVAKDSAGNYLCVDDQGNPQYVLDAGGNRTDTTRWAAIKSGIKAGDFLLIQFGTNDETHDCPRFVSLPDFETDLGIMADAVRAKGATAIFVTPMGHRSFTGTMVRNTLLPYANAMKDEATMKGVEVADLNLRSVEYYMMVGTDYLATNIFDGGTTHFIKAGAIEMASLIVGELRKNGGPLAVYLK
jgi:lysophospholipase L1-like esterase